MSILGYTIPALAAVAVVIVWELTLLRTGLFRRPAYWISMLIVLGFQVPVDGWLTKLSGPIVRYDDRAVTGIRVPWDIPVEDFLFGWALVTATLLLWTRAGARHPDRGHARRHHPPRNPPRNPPGNPRRPGPPPASPVMPSTRPRGTPPGAAP